MELISTFSSIEPLDNVELIMVTKRNAAEVHISDFFSGLSTSDKINNVDNWAKSDPTLFLCREYSEQQIDSTLWVTQKMPLSQVVEILAMIDQAKECSVHNHIIEKGHNNDELSLPIVLHMKSTMIIADMSKMITVLFLTAYPEVASLMNALRRTEAYGMMRFILKDPSSSVALISQRYGLSAPYFQELFRRWFNSSTKKKLMSIRLASAVLKLIETKDTIVDVGLASGYCSAAHFSTDVKKELGCTPRELRQLEKILYEK